MTHASVAGSPLEVPRDLVRLSVGIEAVDDLLADLAAGARLTSAAPGAAPIRVQGLRKVYDGPHGPIVAVDGIDLEIINAQHHGLFRLGGDDYPPPQPFAPEPPRLHARALLGLVLASRGAGSVPSINTNSKSGSSDSASNTSRHTPFSDQRRQRV